MNLSIWPYHSGNTVVDLVLFLVFSFVFGWAMGLGWRVAGKLP